MSDSHVRLFATQWTAAYQAPPSMGFARQEYWSGVPVMSSPQEKPTTMGMVPDSQMHGAVLTAYVSPSAVSDSL